jgi:peptidyl serine alpha-galactosyltransferase
VTLFVTLCDLLTFDNLSSGVHHWLENVLGYPDDASKEHDNDVVILVDPDMLLMRPFVNDFSEFPLDLWTSHNRKKAQKEPLLTKVLPGKPMAQDYNYGEAFLEAAESNLTHVVGKDSPIHNLTRQDAKVLYSGGPPYVFTAKDMRTSTFILLSVSLIHLCVSTSKSFFSFLCTFLLSSTLSIDQVTTYWTKFLPRLFDIFPKFMAEMYAYNLATAHLEMPQQLARGFMVSNVVLDQGEGWYFLKDVPPEQICHRSTKRFTPQVLHFCQRYSIGDYFISKYMYPDLIQCDTPLVRLPEKDAAVRYNFSHYGDGTTDTWPEKKEHLKNKNAFMVCMLLPAINDAARYYKTNHCSERANYNETWEYFAWKEEENQKKKPRRE